MPIPSIPSIKGLWFRAIRRPAAAAGGTFTYLRTDGTSSIFRPDGTSLYIRP